MILFINYLKTKSCELGYKNGRDANYLDYALALYPNVTNLLIADDVDLGKQTLRNVLSHPTRSILRTTPNVFDITTISNLTTLLTGYEVLICDFFVLLNLIEDAVPIQRFKKIIIFDCLDVTTFFRKKYVIKHMEKYGTLSFYVKASAAIKKNKDKITFLITDFNKDDLEKTGLNYKIYYKKINFDSFNRDFIKSLDRKDELCMFYSPANTVHPEYHSVMNTIRTEYPEIVITENFMDSWQYQNILYTQKPYVGFIEQFGRAPFEKQYFGYNVIQDHRFSIETSTGIHYYNEYYKSRSMNLSDENTFELLMELV